MTARILSPPGVGRPVCYETVEAAPLEMEMVRRLNYCEQLERPDLQPVFERMHAAPWGVQVEIVPGFTLLKEAAGFTVEKLPGPPGKREILRATQTNSSLPHPSHP